MLNEHVKVCWLWKLVYIQFIFESNHSICEDNLHKNCKTYNLWRIYCMDPQHWLIAEFTPCPYCNMTWIICIARGRLYTTVYTYTSPPPLPSPCLCGPERAKIFTSGGGGGGGGGGCSRRCGEGVEKRGWEKEGGKGCQKYWPRVCHRGMCSIIFHR